MAITTPKSAFLHGIIDGAPFLLVIAPFATLFGLLATEAGLSVFETLTFSVLVIAGAAQFTALQLMQENAPTIVVLASALAVNLRMAMYSAALVPHLGTAPGWQRAIGAYLLVDQTYALSQATLEARPAWSTGDRMAYFAGTALPVFPGWVGGTLAGAVLGFAKAMGEFGATITFVANIPGQTQTLPSAIWTALQIPGG